MRVRSSGAPSLAWGVGLGALGILALFHPTLLSGMREMQPGPGDPFFAIFLLEHHWLWISGGEAAPAFWDLPMGYPLRGTLASSDLLFSFSPLYWPWRSAGIDPETSFQLWCLAMAALNYAAMWLLLERLLGVSRLAAVSGAYVFAFSAARVAQLGHEQLLPQIFVVGALACAIGFFRTPAGARRRPRLCLWGFAACIVAQLHGGFYLGYFMLIVSVVTLLWAWGLGGSRHSLVTALRAEWVHLCAAVVAAALALTPLVTRYFETAARGVKVGVGAAEPRLPRLASYLFMGPDSWLYGWQADVWPFRDLPEANEQAIGLGLFTTAVTLVVTWRTRHGVATRLTVLVVATCVVALTWFPGEIRMWRLWYYAVPGMEAIRAVSRMGLLLAIPAGIAVAYWVDGRRPGWRGRWVVVVAAACALEQLATSPSFDKARAQCEFDTIAARIDRGAAAFYLLHTGGVGDNLLALPVAQRARIPTVNFYGGRFPIDWPFLYRAGGESTPERAHVELDRWMSLKGMGNSAVQLVADPYRGVVDAACATAVSPGTRRQARP